MELNTNDKHKKIDLRKLNWKKSKNISTRVGSVVLALSLFSGCGRISRQTDSRDTGEVPTPPAYTDADESYTSRLDDFPIYEGVDGDGNSYQVTATVPDYDIPNHSPEETVELPFVFLVEFDDDRTVTGNVYTYEDLEHITKMTVIVREDGDYDFLNYMPHLQNLSIIDNSTGDKLDNIDGARFGPDISISIESPTEAGIFDEDHYPFLRDISSIDTLTLGSSSTNAFYIDSSYLQSLRNVHNLSMAVDINSNFQYQDLTYLDSLVIDALPYDAALYFPNEVLDQLEQAGVSVSTINMEKLREVNQQIHDIYLSLDIPEDATDQEKLDIILVYVLEHLEYDSEMHEAIQNGDDTDLLAENFYTEGEMTAAFESSSQICGNYATLFYVLAREAGLDAYNLTSYNHAWNAVKVGDYYYFVDPTWLDGENISIQLTNTEQTDTGISISYDFEELSAEDVLASGDSENVSKLVWYMEDPTEIADIDNQRESHDYRALPPGLILSSIPDQEVPEETAADLVEEDVVQDEVQEEDTSDISNKKFKIHINGKTFIIGGAAFVGILSGLGIGVLIHKKNMENKRRRSASHQTSSWNPTYSSSFSWDDSFGSSSFGSDDSFSSNRFRSNNGRSPLSNPYDEDSSSRFRR